MRGRTGKAEGDGSQVAFKQLVRRETSLKLSSRSGEAAFPPSPLGPMVAPVCLRTRRSLAGQGGRCSPRSAEAHRHRGRQVRGTAQPLGGGRWQGLQRLRLPSHALGSCPTADWSRGARAFHPCCLLDGIAKPDQGLSPGPRRVLGGGSTVARPQRPPQETELLLFVCLARAGPRNHRPLQMYAAEKGCSPGLEIAPSPTLFQSSLYSLGLQ